MALPILDGNQTAATLSTVLTGGEHIPAHTVVSLGSQAITDVRSAVSGSVVSISNFPSTQTIAGTVTANLSTTDYSEIENIRIGTDSIDAKLTSVAVGSLPAISGTVTANGGDFAGEFGGPVPSKGILIGFNSGGTFADVNTGSGLPVYISDYSPSQFPVVPADGTPNFPISGTVTISNFPRPTWTDYSGSVVTANSAVTAISTITRSYLLAQVTTGQMFLNIGATCTTSNGVYFSAGQGFAWETSVPQGVVSIISGVAGTKYVLKDG